MGEVTQYETWILRSNPGGSSGALPIDHIGHACVGADEPGLRVGGNTSFDSGP